MYFFLQLHIFKHSVFNYCTINLSVLPITSHPNTIINQPLYFTHILYASQHNFLKISPLFFHVLQLYMFLLRPVFSYSLSEVTTVLFILQPLKPQYCHHFFLHERRPSVPKPHLANCQVIIRLNIPDSS